MPNNIIYIAQLPFTSQTPGDLRVTKNAYFFLSTHGKQPLFVTFYDIIAGIGYVMGGTDGKEGWTNLKVKTVMEMKY